MRHHYKWPGSKNYHQLSQWLECSFPLTLGKIAFTFQGLRLYWYFCPWEPGFCKWLREVVSKPRGRWKRGSFSSLLNCFFFCFWQNLSLLFPGSVSAAPSVLAQPWRVSNGSPRQKDVASTFIYLHPPRGSALPWGGLGSVSSGAKYPAPFSSQAVSVKQQLSVGVVLPNPEFMMSLVSILLPWTTAAADKISWDLPPSLFVWNTQSKKWFPALLAAGKYLEIHGMHLSQSWRHITEGKLERSWLY